VKRERVACDKVEPVFPPYPLAVKAAGLVFLSGVRAGSSRAVARRFDDLPPAGRGKQQGYALADRDEGIVSAESWGAHENLEKILQAAGSSGDQLLRQHIWQRDKRFFPCYEAIRKHWQPSPAPSSGLGVKSLSGWGERWIGIDGIAVAGDGSRLFTPRKVVAAVDDKALPSASHYSQAVQSGPFVFTAGHIAIKTNEPGKPLVNSFDDVPPEGRFLATGRSHPDSRDGPIAAQSWYVMKELRRTLEDRGLRLRDVINVSVFLADLRDFATFHRVHRHFFPDDPPALCVVGFDEVGHRGCRIEIELTAMQPVTNVERRPVAWTGPPPLHAPAAMRAGPLIFFSGIVGLDASGEPLRSGASLPREAAKLVEPLEKRERVPGLAAQCWAAFDTLRSAAARAGSSLDDVVKTTIYLGHEDDLAIYESVRSAFLDDKSLPAFECILVHGPGPVAHAHVQIEAIGVMGGS
jgi:enamine deaminase RidA (YjgF/YER057c/UK114 family)